MWFNFYPRGYKMKFLSKALVFGLALCGSGTLFAADADSTLRQLAENRGRFIGGILNSDWFNNALGEDASTYEALHKANFNMVVAENEMKFDATEPSRGNFSYTKAEKLMSYAAENGMQVRGHALSWHSQVPSWVGELGASVESAGGSARDTLLKVLKNHIYNVVGHFKGQIREWDVVNEAVNDNSTRGWRSEGSVWYQYIGRDFIDSSFVWAHEADPDAKLYYNDYALEWGMGENSKAQFVYDSVASRFKKAGIYITGIGTQTHIENTHTSIPANVRTFASKLKSLGLTLQITELDIGFSSSKTSISAAEYAAQGHLYRQLMDVFLESDNMEAFVIWGLSDKYSWLKDQGKYNGLIFDSNFVKKPAYDSLVASLKAHDASTVTKAGSVDPVEWESASSKFGKATYVIVDYSVAGSESVGSWSSDVTAGSPEYVATAGYMKIPLAGCDQSESSCGYQHAIYTLPDDAVSKSVMSKCENLILTMQGIDGVNYVNVGVNAPWFSLQYGVSASGTAMTSATVDLQHVRDSSAAPTQITLNSNGSGVYLSKIEAAGCPDDFSGISKAFARGNLDLQVVGKTLAVRGAENATVELFDIGGRPVLSERNVNGTLSLKALSSGLYVVRVRAGALDMTRRIVVR